MATMQPILPTHFAKAGVFVSREVFFSEDPNGQGPFRRDEELSEPPVETKINQFREETGAQLVQIASPSIQVYNGRTPQEVVRFVGVSVLYFTPLETTNDLVQPSPPNSQLGPGNMGGVAAKADPAHASRVRKAAHGRGKKRR